MEAVKGEGTGGLCVPRGWGWGEVSQRCRERGMRTGAGLQHGLLPTVNALLSVIGTL